MANFNKVILVGRLTRDPESKSFANGGKVTKIGFAVTNRKKDSQSGQWVDDPCFIDCEVFNRGETGKLADLVADRCRKGSQLMIEGRLHLEQWDDKNGGGKRSKHKIVIESVQLLDGKPAQGDQQGGGTQPAHGESVGDQGAGDGSSASGGGDDIPF